MLEFFRSFAKSKFGIGIVIGFLVLLMLGFAAGDISNYFSSARSGSVSGDAVASVDGKDIKSDDLRLAASNALDNVRKDNPTATMKALLAGGGLEELLTTLIDRKALVAFATSNGIAPGKRLVDSEITKIPAFRGADGKFSESQYKGLIGQRGITDTQFRDDVTASLVSRELLLPAEYAAIFPNEMSQRYAALLKERRVGAIAVLPSAAFAAKAAPGDAELKDFYTRHSNDYMRPERRVIRYAMLDESVIKNVAAPSDAEIARRYNENKAQYAASETRNVTQLILPTEAAANAVLAEVKGGKTLEASASSKGLGAAALDKVTKDSLAGQSSQAVADATFSAGRGSIAGPVKSALGWHLMRVDAVTSKPERSLEQARAEIATALTGEKRIAALNDFTAEVQDDFDNGSALGDEAKKLGVTIGQTEPLTADGGVFGKPGLKVSPQLMSVLTAAFGMEQGKPDIAVLQAGKSFIIYDLASVTASAPAPLAEIRPQVSADFMLQQGAKAARTGADKALAAVKQGGDLSKAVADLGVPLPPVNPVSMRRDELIKAQKEIPVPLRLLFNMAAGTNKILPLPRNQGFYVVQLKTIELDNVAANDPLVGAAKQELSRSAGREYAEQLRAAIRNEVGASRNAAAVKALTKTLSGGN